MMEAAASSTRKTPSQDRGDSDGPDAVQPRVIGLVVLAGRSQGCRETPLINTVLSPSMFQYGPMRTASDSPVHAEP
jgi:hypothetical protein